ncbi:hypothetical protein BJ165DRAFT_1409866 [Panaeolus papilionaceus]|nr:hypothetical protein BJ165DRAFT_1409866 [Panaeolus papilionaceus]
MDATVIMMHAMAISGYAMIGYSPKSEIADVEKDFQVPQNPSFEIIQASDQQNNSYGNRLVQTLKDNSNLIPVSSDPSCVFFLLSEANFRDAVHCWFGAALAEKKLVKVESGRLSKSCPECIGCSQDEKCHQEIVVDVKKLLKDILQCGVSFLPQDKVNVHLLAKNREAHALWHPARDLNLTEIRANEDVIKHCGYQLYAIYDNTEEHNMLDFYVYSAFSDNALERFIKHNTHIRKLKMKPLQRGSQFAQYGQGEMFTHGARAPMGGRAGDSYVFYDGMEGITKEGLESLFDLAEDSMMLLEFTRVLNFNIFKDIKEAAGIYFVPRRGSLWSFKGSSSHGTMLPSKEPLESEDGSSEFQNTTSVTSPDIHNLSTANHSSTGIHVTVTKANSNAAKKYKGARVVRPKVEQYWSVV